MPRKEWHEWFPWRPVAGLIGAALVCAGIGLLFFAHSLAREARVVATTTRLTPAGLAAAADGSRVMVEGRIDPASGVMDPRRQLAMFEFDNASKAANGSRTWTSGGATLPNFRLEGGGAGVLVRAGSYRLRRPSYDESTRPRLDDDRTYRGFKAGDQVLVDGIVRRGALQDAVVFGGNGDAYLADTQSDAPTLRLVALGCLLVGGLHLLYLWRTGARAGDRGPAVR